MSNPSSRPARAITLADDPAYWQALGRFIEMFATAKNMLLSYLAKITPVTIPTSRAIFYSWRADAAIEAVRRLWQVQAKWKELNAAAELAEIDDVLSHFKAINMMRNLLVHHTTFVTSDKGRVTSNMAHALTVKHIRERRAEAGIVDQMTADLWKAAHHFMSLMLKPDASPAERAKTFPVLAGAWQYKPDEDRPPPKKPHKGHGKGARSSPPRSSQG